MTSTTTPSLPLSAEQLDKLHGFDREDLQAIADWLEAGYEKHVDVGGSPLDGLNHIESTTAAAARFIRTALIAQERTAQPPAEQIARVILRLIGEGAMDWSASAPDESGHEDAFQSDDEELRVLVNLVNRALTAQQATASRGEPETCLMCNDSGIVGFPPDQYEECPDCIKARASHGAPNDEWTRNLLAQSGRVVARLFNDTPNVSDAVEAGEVIQWLAALVSASHGAQAPDDERAVKLFESILAKDPQAFQREGETVYQVTKAELLEFTNALANRASSLAGVTNEEFHTLRRLIECAEKLDARPRPMCRDCADEDGVCPNSGLECDMRKLFADAKRLHDKLLANRASSAKAMQPLSAGLPSPEEHDRVLVYTEGVDFAGEQYFDIRADEFDLPLEERREVVQAATHWMPRPHPGTAATPASDTRTKSDMSDAQIEEGFKAAGGRWDGSHWVIEDADLHPFVRSFAQASDTRAAVPDGWKLVPLEPTIEMIAAMQFKGDIDIAIGHAQFCKEAAEDYAAMLAAAPTAAIAEADAKDAARYRWLRDQARSVDWSHKWMNNAFSTHCRTSASQMDRVIDASMSATQQAQNSAKGDEA